MVDSAAGITLKRGDQQRTDNACHRGDEQKKPKVSEQTVLHVMRNIQLNPLRYEWPLKGICRPGNQGDDSELGERHGDTARANSGNPNRIRQRCNHVDYECKSAMINN